MTDAQRSEGTPEAGGAGEPSMEGPHAAAMHFGTGHTVMFSNAAFATTFGGAGLGMPAREVMVGLPAEAFALMDRVLREGRPLARQVRLRSAPRRLVVVPRVDPETHETYGVTTHLVPPGWRGPRPEPATGPDEARRD
jgi:hypothetical protein